MIRLVLKLRSYLYTVLSVQYISQFVKEPNDGDVEVRRQYLSKYVRNDAITHIYVAPLSSYTLQSILDSNSSALCTNAEISLFGSVRLYRINGGLLYAGKDPDCTLYQSTYWSVEMEQWDLMGHR